MSKLKIVTQGEYSDYSMLAIVEWKSEKTPEQAADEFISLGTEGEDEERVDFYKFVAWLIQKGYATELEANEFHLGSYGDLKERRETRFERSNF